MQATKDKFLLLLVIIVGLASIGRHQWSLRSIASSGTKQALDGLVVVHNKNDRRIQKKTGRLHNIIDTHSLQRRRSERHSRLVKKSRIELPV